MFLASYLIISLVVGVVSNYRSTKWTVGVGTVVVCLGVAANAVINNAVYLSDQWTRIGMAVFEALFHYTLASFVTFLIPFAFGRYVWFLVRKRRAH
ncbi:MAG: hypothetical protein ACRD1X_07525 [Vicinamibacteria bacterium]